MKASTGSQSACNRPPLPPLELVLLKFTNTEYLQNARGDALHRQERTLAASGIDSRNYGNGVYVPTGADTGVITL